MHLCLRLLHFCVSAENVLEGCCWQRLPGQWSGIWEDCGYLYFLLLLLLRYFVCACTCRRVGREQGAVQWQVVEVRGQLVGVVLFFLLPL